MTDPRPCGPSPRARHTAHAALLLATTALTSPLLIAGAAAQTLPTGGSVAAGSVAITQPSATQLNITQSSQSAVVNWQGFSVGQGNSVNFAQPGASSAILNRVTSSAPSTIAGSITANGQVYLVNPNGIAITPSGTVNVGGGFVASTLGISDADFMAGRRTFTGNGVSAAVSNEGVITVGRGGYAALIGGTVSNAGVINVPLGKVGLGSGEQATLDFSGDGFLQVAVPTQAGGRGALVRNSGSITADGGSVTLSAATAREAARNAVNISGVVQARSISGHNGSITIGGGEGGRVKITGRLDASSSTSQGGRIAVTGRNIKLKGATVDASGAAGGGTINIGGGRQGQGPLQRAVTTTIDAATTLRADATSIGNGGNVIVWSDNLTTFAGQIFARGGAYGGNGGFVETSGAEKLSVRETAYVNTLAPHGTAGDWLLDPKNIIIQAGGSTGAITSDTYGNNPSGTDTIAPSAITGAASNVTLQASNDITVNSAVTMSNPVMLTLNAGRSIAVNANITSAGGFTATINDAGATAIYRDPGQAAFTMAANTVISTASSAANGGAVSITTGTLASDSSGATSLAANIGNITLATINTSGTGGANFSGAGGNITVTNSQGSILSAASGAVGLNASAAVATSGTAAGKNGGTIQLNAGGAIGSSTTPFGAIASNGANGLGTNQAGGNGGAITLTAGTSMWTQSVLANLGVRTGTGTVGVNGNILMQATNGSITLTTDVLPTSNLTLTANTGTGVVTIQPLTASTTMGINNAGSTLNLTTANLATITARTLNFGNAATLGQITIGAIALPSTIGNVVVTSASPDLVADGAIKVTGNITGASGNLTLNATTSDIYLLSGTISVGTFAANAATYITSASGTYTNASGTASFSAGTPAGIGDPNYGNLSFSGTLTAGTLTLNAQGQVYSGFRIAATNLLVTGGGTFNLFTASTINQTTSTNTIGTLAANVTGTLNVSNNANLTIGSVGGVNGVTAGTFRLVFAGTRTLTQTQAITAGTMSLVGTGAGTYTLTNPGNSIGVFGAGVATGTLNLAGVNGLTVAGTLLDDQGNTVATGIVGGTVTLNNTGTVTQNGRISATNLELLGTGGNYILTNAANVIGTLAANTGSINVARSSAAVLTVGTAGGTTGITTTGAVTLTGNSTANNGIAVNAAITAGGGATLLSVGGIAVAANITATGGSSIALRPDTGANGSLTRAVTFSGGAQAITSGAGVSSIYFNTASYTTPSQNYAGNVTGNLRQYMYVTTLQNLQDMSTNLNGSYALNRDIDASATASWNGGAGFAPVGSGASSFRGSFDGLGHVISGLVINRPSENFVGLFGNAFNANISNVGLAGGSITGGVGVGSLIGTQFGGSVSNSTSSASVTGNINVGGLIGFADGAIRTSYATGNVTGNESVGGLAGYLDGTITQSYATGLITGTLKVGGLVGELEPGLGVISSSYWDTQTSGRSNAVGSGSSAGATGLTSAQFGTAANFTGWTFGTTAGGPGWVIVNVDSTLNNAGGAAGATRPMLLAEASTNGVITSSHQLQLMALNLAGSYSLGGNVDMSETARASGVWLNGAGFVPIGYAATDGNGTVPTSGTFAVTAANPFSGSFNGQGFTISNLTINRPTTDYVGLFGYAYNSTGNQIIKNVNLVGGSITGRDHVGSILGGNRGYLDDGYTAVPIYLNDTTTASSSSSATVNGRDFVGGMYGSVESAWSYFNTGAGTVNGRDYVGGVVGWINSGAGFNTDMRSAAAVSGRNNVGGLGGYFAVGLSGLNYATGNVTATGNNIGGAFGYFYGTLSGTATYATGAVSGVDNVGGLAGFSGGQITQAFATGAVTGRNNVGGLVGNNDGTTLAGYVDLSFASGIVRGVTNVGGLVGYNTNLIGAINGTGATYATGAVYGTTNVGGLVGYNLGDGTTTYGRINTSYSIGYVSGTTNVGGLVGNSASSGTGTYRGYVINSYFNSETSGQSNGLGAGTTGTGGIATASMPKTTAQLQAALQTGFSTTPWGIVANTSYPYLKWLYGSAPQVVAGTAYSDRGATVLPGVAANLLVSGLTGTAANVAASAVGSTGANGAFYFLVPNGTLTAGSPKQVLAYTDGASGGATFQQNASASIAGLSIYGTYLKEQGAATTLSALNTALSTAVGSNAKAQARLSTLANLELNPTGASFAIDQAINTGTLVLSGAASWTQSASITAANLVLLGAGGSFTLTNAGNAVGTLAANTGTINFTNNAALTIGSVIGTNGLTGTGAVTVASVGNLTIASTARVVAGSNNNVVLSATGNFVNNRGSDAIGVSGTGRWLVYSSAPGSNTFGNLDSQNTAIWNATLASLAPASVPSGSRYIFAQAATLTVTTTDTSKTYGDNAAVDVATRYTITGYQPGVTGAFLGDSAGTAYSGTLSVTSAGSAATAGVANGPYTITATGLTGLNGYSISYANTGTLTVNRAALTVTASDASKTYGDVVSFTGTEFTTGAGQLRNGETIGSVMLSSTGAAATAGVAGGPYAITASGASGGTFDAANYAITYNAGTLTVNRAALTVTANDASKTYGDTISFTGTEFTTGPGQLRNNETIGSVMLSSTGAAATASVAGGPYAITASGAGGGTFDAANYSITYNTGALTVNRAALTVTANDASKTYGDTISFTGTEFTTGPGQLRNNETIGSVTLSSTGAAATAGVAGGPYAITASGASGGTFDAANYAITYNAGTLTVNRAALTVTANDASKTYGDVVSFTGTEFTTGAGQLRNGETIGSVMLSSTGAAATAGVAGGPYAITASGASGGTFDAANYAITYNAGSLTVNRAALTVTANDASKTYGDTISFTGTEFTTGPGQLRNNETIGSVMLSSTGAAATAGVANGPYAITASGASGGTFDAANYAITYNAAALTVSARQITVTADAQSRVYGDANPALTYQVGGRGLVNGDTLSGDLSTAATTTSNVGSYSIDQNTLAASSNYALTYVGANLAVTQRALRVTADAQSRVYGDANPALTYQVGGHGLVNGDTLTGDLSTAATTASNVGSYGIAQGSLAASSNYALTYTGANLAVTQRALTVTAGAQSRVYGDANPALTYQVGGRGFVNGDGLTGELSTAATTTSNVGSYSIDQNTLAASSNYALTYVGANLAVTQRALTVTADAQSRVYGDANPALTYQVGGRGLVNGDALTGDLSTAATTTSNVGSYGIAQGSLAASSNYALTYTGANLAVTQRALTVTADAQSRVYGDANPALTYTIGGRGLVNGDTLSGGLATPATTASNVGSYAINQGSLASSSNYTLTYTGANLAVTPRPLVVTADAQIRIFGFDNPALTYRVGGRGLVNGDALTGALATDATAASPIGRYAIVQGTLAAASNYVLTYVGADIVVAPAAPVAVASLASSVTRDAFDPVALPEGAVPLVGVPPVNTSLGEGVFYADPRFEAVYVCFAGVTRASTCFRAQ